MAKVNVSMEPLTARLLSLIVDLYPVDDEKKAEARERHLDSAIKQYCASGDFPAVNAAIEALNE